MKAHSMKYILADIMRRTKVEGKYIILAKREDAYIRNLAGGSRANRKYGARASAAANSTFLSKLQKDRIFIFLQADSAPHKTQAGKWAAALI